LGAVVACDSTGTRETLGARGDKQSYSRLLDRKAIPEHGQRGRELADAATEQPRQVDGGSCEFLPRQAKRQARDLFDDIDADGSGA
jgi:hypothetical protein